MAVKVKPAQGFALPVVPADNGGPTIRVEVQRPADTTAYTANDVIGTAGGAMLTIPNAVRREGGAAYLQGVTVMGNQANGGGAETWQPRIWIHQKPRLTTLADNAAFTGSFTILQATGFQTERLLSALAAPAGSTIDKAVEDNIAIKLQAAPDSRDLYFDLQTLTGFTPASGALYAVVFALVWV